MFGKKYATPDALQRTLIVTAAISYVAGAVQMAMLLYQQAMTNPNYSGNWTMVIWQVVPLVLFGLAYFLNPRKLTLVQRLFESVVLTIAGILAFGALSQVVFQFFSLGSLIGGSIDSYLFYESLSVATLIVVFGAVLFFLARTKRWK